MFHRINAAILTLFIAVSALAVDTGDNAPAWTGKNQHGEEIRFPDIIAGKPTVMVYWATWCPYCKAFMPYLEKIQEDYGSDEINVLLINHKERGIGDPVQYLDTLHFPNVAILEGDSIGDAYGIDFIPGLLIIDADGTVAWRRKSTDLPAGQTVAELWDSQIREQLDRLL